MTSTIIVKAPFTLADTSDIAEQAARFLADSLGTIHPVKPELAVESKLIAENDGDDTTQAA